MADQDELQRLRSELGRTRAERADAIQERDFWREEARKGPVPAEDGSDWVGDVTRFLNAKEFGEVVIRAHQGKVVEVRLVEKIRYQGEGT
jgi:hypothetical protein